MRLYLDNCCFNRPFDYTRWQETLFDGMSVRELSRLAMNSTQKTKIGEQ